MDNDVPWVLGIASSHNGAACLLQGSRLVVAVQEERLLRKKRAEHPGGFPSLSVSYCLDYAGIDAAQLDAVVLCAAMSNKTKFDDIYLNPQLQVVRNGTRTLVIPHHFGHAVAVYALSGMPSTGILIVDGNGSFWNELFESERGAIGPEQLAAVRRPGRTDPREHVSLYCADEGVIKPIEKHIASYAGEEFQTLGDMYGYVGRQIFDSFYEGPGKVMGLAPYGKPALPIEEFYRITSRGFEFQDTIVKRFRHHRQWPEHKEEYQDLAASVQAAIEKAVLHLCSRLRAVNENLCYAGGVALNSVANEKIIREAGFKNVFIMPAAEDSGTSIGAAYYGLWNLRGYSRIDQLMVDSLGRQYLQSEISSAIRKLPGLVAKRQSNVGEVTADLLAQRKIVGWFQGGSELGPALSVKEAFFVIRGTQS